MNGMRIARKSIKRLTKEDLIVLWEMTKDDNTHEGMVIHYLLHMEMVNRKIIK